MYAVAGAGKCLETEIAERLSLQLAQLSRSQHQEPDALLTHGPHTVEGELVER